MSYSHSALIFTSEQVKEQTFVLVHGVSGVLSSQWESIVHQSTSHGASRNKRENCRKAPWETQAKVLLQSLFLPPKGLTP